MDVRTFVNGGIPIKKAIHVGAAQGKQVKNYVDSGVELVIWVEPQLQIFNQLIKNTISFPITPNLKAIQSEVNFGERYKNNPTKEELKQYVESFGFNSAYWFMVDNNSWGDLGWTKL